MEHIELKKYLMAEQEAWAECQNRIEKEIEQNPDVSKEALLSLADAVRGGKKQHDIAVRLIDSYYRYRKNMTEVYDSNGGDAHALAKKLTGVDCADGEFLEAKKGMISVDFFADNMTARRMHGEESPDPNDRILLAGFKKVSGGGKPVLYTVTIVPAENIERTQKHEIQHAIEHLFQEEFKEMNSSAEIDFLWEEYSSKESGNEKETEGKSALLQKYVLAEEKLALEKSKDEILAHKKSGDKRNVTYILLEPKKEGGLYDYFFTVEERMKNEQDKNMSETWKKLWDEIVVSHYANTVEKSEQAFKDIEKSHSTEFAVALLSDLPIEKWEKTERRMKEN